jgi:uncharacterized protein
MLIGKISYRPMLHALNVLLWVGFLAGCSDYQKARSAYEAGDYSKAFKIFEQLSQAGNNRAQYDLSLMYLQGIGTDKNIAQSWTWMNRAAEAGNIQAMLELGVRYQKSASLENGSQMAFAWFEKAAMAGSAAGQYNLSRFYQNGDVVPADIAQAYVWLTLSNEFGNPVAASEAKNLKARLTVAELEKANEKLMNLRKTIQKP